MTTLTRIPPAQRTPAGVAAPCAARWRRRGELTAGARSMLPLVAGVAPFGVVLGVTVAGGPGPVLAGWSTSVLIYGGSAQLVAVELLAKSAPPLVVLVSVLAVNARLAFYGSALAPHWRGTPLWWRAFAAYLIIDPSFAVGIERYERDAGKPTSGAEDAGAASRARSGHAYYLGGAGVLWLGWQLAIAVGLTVGSVVPPGLELDFVVPVYLVAMVLPKLTTAATTVAVAVGAVTAAGGTLLPLHAGLVLGIVAGIGAGLAVRDNSPRESS